MNKLKVVVGSVIGVITTASLVFVSAGAAGAASLWEDINYSKPIVTDVSHVYDLGDYNNRASSLKTGGDRTTIFADTRYGGASWTTSSDWNNLHSISYNLNWPDTWGDNIGSFHKG